MTVTLVARVGSAVACLGSRVFIVRTLDVLVVGVMVSPSRRTGNILLITMVSTRMRAGALAVLAVAPL